MSPVNSPSVARIPSLNEAAQFAPEKVVGLCQELAQAQHQVEQFKDQIDWFKRQLFGQESERRILDDASGQLNLGELSDPGHSHVPAKQRVIAGQTRSVPAKKPESGEESLPFFDETRVPVELIELTAPEALGLAPEDYEIISHEVSYLSSPGCLSTRLTNNSGFSLRHFCSA